MDKGLPVSIPKELIIKFILLSGENGKDHLYALLDVFWIGQLDPRSDKILNVRVLIELIAHALEPLYAFPDFCCLLPFYIGFALWGASFNERQIRERKPLSATESVHQINTGDISSRRSSSPRQGTQGSGDVRIACQ